MVDSLREQRCPHSVVLVFINVYQFLLFLFLPLLHTNMGGRPGGEEREGEVGREGRGGRQEGGMREAGREGRRERGEEGEREEGERGGGIRERGGIEGRGGEE